MKVSTAPRFCIGFIFYVPSLMFSFFLMCGYFEWGTAGLYGMILWFPPQGNTIVCLLQLGMMFLYTALFIFNLAIYIQFFILFRRNNLTLRNATDFIGSSLKDQFKKTTNQVIVGAVTSGLGSSINTETK